MGSGANSAAAAAQLMNHISPLQYMYQLQLAQQQQHGSMSNKRSCRWNSCLQ